MEDLTDPSVFDRVFEHWSTCSSNDYDSSETEYEEQCQQNFDKAENKAPKWNRVVIRNDGDPLHMIQKILSALVLFNQENADTTEATTFVIGWCPISVAEAVRWIEEIVQKVIISDANCSIDEEGCVTIKGHMVRRQMTTLLNHVKFEAGQRFIIVKMKNYYDSMKGNPPGLLVRYDRTDEVPERNVYLMNNVYEKNKDLNFF